MKTFNRFICLCGIMIFKLMFCSADDALTETKIKEIYKFEPNVTNAKIYKVMKGEIIKSSKKKVLMKIEIPVKKRTADKTTESYIAKETEVFKDLKKGKTKLLSENVVDVLHYGYYDGKKVLIVPQLGKNLKEYSSKPYSWEKLSEIGPYMLNALRFLHSKLYVHQSLKPAVFAFGTEEKQSDKEPVPLKNQVYLFDVGIAEKYKHSNGSHRPCEKNNEFKGEITFASRQAMTNMTHSRRDDIESVFYIVAYLAGVTSPFKETDLKLLFKGKNELCSDLPKIKSMVTKSKIADVRVLNFLVDYGDDLGQLNVNTGYEKEPEYDNLIDCFDQGVTEKVINDNYEFVDVQKFEDKSATAVIGTGNTKTNPKMDVVMKLLKSDPNFSSDFELAQRSCFKSEISVYKDLKKGMKHSLIRENVCDMLHHGIYKGRRAIIMPRLGIDWYEDIDARNGYSFEMLCIAARCAIRSLKFMHDKGYIHRDLKVENFALGRVEPKKNDKSQADMPLKNQMYLFDFGLATKWKYPNGTHKPRVPVDQLVGTADFRSRTSIMKFSQSRRDDMESLLFTFLAAATPYPVFVAEDPNMMWKEKDVFVRDPQRVVAILKAYHVPDERMHKAFTDYAAELNKIFVSDAPEHYEKEPDYNAFCVCFGGKPGKDACAT